MIHAAPNVYRTLPCSQKQYAEPSAYGRKHRAGKKQTLHSWHGLWKQLILLKLINRVESGVVTPIERQPKIAATYIAEQLGITIQALHKIAKK